MSHISHNEQKQKWNEEHATPYALTQMDARKASSALNPFVEFLVKYKRSDLLSVEMGCGKGRNVNYLAKQSIFAKVYGFDFSEVAITEARKRAAEEGVADRVQFDVMDATQPWRYESNTFDVGIDCTAPVDIESPAGRSVAIAEMRRVLKPGAYFLVYVMSTDDEYHQMLIAKSPAAEPHAFIHPETGKFEKVFSEHELDNMYADFQLIEATRINNTTEFFGETYATFMHWRIYQNAKLH